MNGVPGGYAHQAYSSKKYSHYDDDNAASLIGGGGYDTKPHLSQQQQHKHQSRHHSQQDEHHHQYGMTTQGPKESYRNNSRSWSSGDATNRRNWSNNSSRGRQVPTFNSRNRTPYGSFNHRTYYTTTTTTPAPDFPEKVSFDGFDNLNKIESGESDESNYSSDYEYKNAPYANAPQRHNIKQMHQQSHLNIQRDDPVRGASHNGITTNAFHTQHSSNGGDNYPSPFYNDGSTSDRRTIEPTKSFADDFLIRPTTRNTRTIVSAICSFFLLQFVRNFFCFVFFPRCFINDLFAFSDGTVPNMVHRIISFKKRAKKKNTHTTIQNMLSRMNYYDKLCTMCCSTWMDESVFSGST